MRFHERVSPDTTALVNAIKGNHATNSSPIRSALPTIIIAFISGIAGVAGGVLAARTISATQLKIEQKRTRYAESQVRLAKAEEIITLIEESPETMLREKRAMFLTPSHFFVASNDPARVVALVTLYFPNAVTAARTYEARFAQYLAALMELAVRIDHHEKAGKPDQVLFFKVLESGDNVTSAVMKELGKSYKKRVPVTD